MSNVKGNGFSAEYAEYMDEPAPSHTCQGDAAAAILEVLSDAHDDGQLRSWALVSDTHGILASEGLSLPPEFAQSGTR